MHDGARSARRIPVWAPLTATCLGQFMVVLDATIVNVALPSMRRGLHLSETDLQWVVNAYLLTLGGLILLGGRLGDHFGRKRVYLFGGVLFSAASLAGGLAPSGGVLLGARAVQGVGAALLAPGTLSLLTSVYTERRARTRALAIWSAVSAAGAALGVALGGILTDVAGWRSVLFVNVPLGFLVLVLGGLALSETARSGRGKLDVPGALTITAGLTALAYGIVETETYSWGSARTLGVLGVAVMFFALAALIESRAPNPLVPLAIVRRSAIATAVTMMLILGGVITATIYFQSLYLQQVRGLSPLDAGLLMLPAGFIIMATPSLAARVTTRHGTQRVAAASLALAAAGVLWMSRWTVHGSVIEQQVAPSLLFAFGGSVCFFAISVLLTSEMELQHSGLGSGLFNAGRQVGGSIGLAVTAVIAAARTRALSGAGHDSLRAATASGYGFALVIVAALALAGILVIALHARRHPGRTPAQRAAEAPGLAPH